MDPLSKRWCLLSVAVCLLMLVGGRKVSAAAAAADQLALEASGRIEEAVIAALDLQESVGVIVALDVRSNSGSRLERFRSAAARNELRSTAGRVLDRLPEGHFQLAHAYRSIGSLAGRADSEALLALSEDPAVLRVGLDRRLEWSLLEALPIAGIAAARRAGKNGKGVWVAVFDSGVDTDHPDLRKALKAQECFCADCCPNGEDRQSGRGAAEDDVGHGTLVSGTIVSRGRVAPRGAAHKAKLLMVKVGDVNGPQDSAVLAAAEWVLEEMPQVAAINMSFGSDRLFGGNCDRKGAVNRSYAAVLGALRDAGILTFAASGNAGAPGKMVSPACVKDAISVGAVYDDFFGRATFSSCEDTGTQPNELACFTARSSKTDLVAPGVLITAPARGGGVESTVGTSFSSPLAAGCAVLLRKRYPSATPDEIEAALKSSPTRAVDPVNGRSYPALDCAEALDFLGD